VSIEVPALINGSVVLIESALSLSSTTEVIGSLQLQGNSSVLVLGSGSIVIGGMHMSIIIIMMMSIKVMI